MTLYEFLAFEQRWHDEPWTIGRLFLACSVEIQDLGMLETMEHLLNFAMEKIRGTGIVAENATLALVNTSMTVAIAMLQSGKRLLNIKTVI